MNLPRSVDALCVGAAKLLLSATTLALGFRAVSDDDYARLVIAQRFAEAPSLDPSGTSWLPLPFWIYGAAFRAFGPGLVVARAVALALGVAAALSVWLAARWVGASRGGAVLSGVVAAAFPWSVWLGAAPLPEAPTAGLLVLGLAALTVERPRERLWGAVAVAAACFSRYEAWPIAVFFAAASLRDARRSEGGALGRALVAAAAVALAPIALWMAHGVAHHADALFFLRRVAAYREALGASEPLGARLLGPAAALVREAPEVLLAATFCALRAGFPRRLLRPALGALGLLLFLMLGELGGGGPTHHAGRALLTLWYLCAVFVGEAAGRLAERGARSAVTFGVPLALVATALVVQAPFPRDFVDRHDAVDIGTKARDLGAPALLIDTPDYSYLAVTAAFGSPARAEPFDDHDPRHPRPADAFASPAALAARAKRGRWLVVTRAHAELSSSLGALCAQNPGFSLISPHLDAATR